MAEPKKFMSVDELRLAGARVIGPRVVVIDTDGMAHAYSDNRSHGASLRDGEVIWAWIASHPATKATLDGMATLKSI